MALKDLEINRVYACNNEECQAVIAYKQKAGDNFKKKCPFCHKNTLLIESGSTGISFFMDLNKPKTIGALAEKNAKYAIDSGKVDPDKKHKTPFWRSKRKVNFDVLKNPKQYIETGYT